MSNPNEEAIEAEIQAKGVNAPRLKVELVEAKVASETYTKLPSGKVLVCELLLLNGFSVRGVASVVSKENFDEEIARKISRQRAVQEIWQLEGYLLQEHLSVRAAEERGG